MLSSIRSIDSLQLNSEQLDNIKKYISTKILNDLEYNILKNFSFKVDISKGMLFSQEISEDMISPNIFYSIAHIYKDSLENFYNMQYLITHYIKVDWESFLNMTPVESNILYKNFIEDKEKQNQKSSTTSSDISNIVNNI